MSRAHRRPDVAGPLMKPARHGPKGQQRHTHIVAAAAQIVVDAGPGAVSHRSVADRAGVPLSATTYYFDNLDDLLSQAGQLLMAQWAEQAEGVVARAAARSAPADTPSPQAARLLVEATLPPEGVGGHYQQLLAAHASPSLTAAYRDGRSRLDRALAELLDVLGLDIHPALVLAVIDGAVVSALSEGRDVTAHAESLVGRLLALS
ncbi:MAG TPA: TetR family transcriptional regulator [Actinomycetaceae bacterium]|nr:TetR family transcriptional regulator [Actinomycetaceae bacterium]